jgi:hypothetical protein
MPQVSLSLLIFIAENYLGRLEVPYLSIAKCGYVNLAKIGLLNGRLI